MSEVNENDSLFIYASYAESLNIVLLDQAPAHVAQRVQWPENVVLVWLPAYSPELNPVERLWEDLKGRIDIMEAPVRASLSALQEHVAGLVRGYTACTCSTKAIWRSSGKCPFLPSR